MIHDEAASTLQTKRRLLKKKFNVLKMEVTIFFTHLYHGRMVYLPL